MCISNFGSIRPAVCVMELQINKHTYIEIYNFSRIWPSKSLHLIITNKSQPQVGCLNIVSFITIMINSSLSSSVMLMIRDTAWNCIWFNPNVFLYHWKNGLKYSYIIGFLCVVRKPIAWRWVFQVLRFIKWFKYKQKTRVKYYTYFILKRDH